MLLDTSGLLCFHHRSERQHGEAVRYFEAAPIRLTHSYVLAEFVALAEARGLPREPALAFVAELQGSPVVETVFVHEALHRDARSLLQDRLDKSWSLCDAVSFLLMEETGITDALTTDSHFDQARKRRLLSP